MTRHPLAHRAPAWTLAAALGIGLIGIYFTLSDGSLVQSFGYDGIGVIAIAGIVVGIRRNRPEDPVAWRYFALAIGTSVAADLLSSGYDLLGITEPVPSFSDVLYLAAYPFYFLALWRLSRRVTRVGWGHRWMDATIVTLGVLAAFWALVVDNYLRDQTVGALEKIVLTAYPVMDVGLLFIVLNGVLVERAWARVDSIIVVGITVMLIGDFVYDILVSRNTYSLGNPVDATWLLNYVLIAVAALHPSMAERPVGKPRPLARMSLVPIMVLAGFTAPALMIFDERANIPVLAAITMASAALSTLRMSAMFDELRGQARQLEARTIALQDALDARENLEADLLHQALHDGLTGLANRALLNERIEHAVVLSGRDRRSVAVILCDIDGFKTVNDSLGHQAGDVVLTTVAERIASVVRPGDTVARLGGDEFAVFMDVVTEPAQAVNVAERMLSAVREPCTVHGHLIALSASAGITFGGEGKSPEQLISESDAAMYAAKAGGKDRFMVFEPSMRSRAVERLRFTNSFAGALERGEFYVVYQPLVTLENGHLKGFEALVRWRHPTLGTVAPPRFIGLAEETGFIVPLGRWVLETACKTAMTWPESSGVLPTVSVNLSTHQFLDPNLVRDVREILKSTRLPGERLVLEITESVLVGDLDKIVPTLRELKDLGITIAIDDFGTGYSSLGRLRKFPIDILKIDKVFVDQLDEGAGDSRAFVEAIIRLARELGVTTIAEGIEVAEQRDALRQMGCDGGQGYLLSRPLDVDAAMAYIRGTNQTMEVTGASA